jgi:hypothetical protein
MPLKKKPLLIPCWKREYKIKNENSETTADRDNTRIRSEDNFHHDGS